MAWSGPRPGKAAASMVEAGTAGIGIDGAKQAAGSRGRAEGTTGMAGRSVIFRGVGQMRKYLENGESFLLERGVKTWKVRSLK